MVSMWTGRPAAASTASGCPPPSRSTIGRRGLYLVAGKDLFLLSSASHPSPERLATAVVHMDEAPKKVTTRTDKGFLPKMSLDRVQTGLLSSIWAALAARR